MRGPKCQRIAPGSFLNPSSKVLHYNAGQRQRHEGIKRQPRTGLPHKEQGQHGEDQRVRRVHDRRPQQHADGIQIVGGAGHDVAGAVSLVIRVRKRFQVREEVIAQLVFNIPRNADHQPARQELENPLAQANHHQHKGVRDDLLPGNAAIEGIDRAANDLGKQRPYSVRKQDAQRAPDQSASVFP